MTMTPFTLLLFIGVFLSQVDGREPSSVTGLKLSRVVIVHRHGDRSPITPMADEAYWASTLPDKQTLEAIERTTEVVKDSDLNEFLDSSSPRSGMPQESKHLAKGGPIFGQLSQLGLFQMIALGAQLKAELDETLGLSVEPSDVTVYSTDFPRTIQSVQGTLMGMFDNAEAPPPVFKVEASYTQIMIPDPQPRNSKEQVALEKVLTETEEFQMAEESMIPLAKKATSILRASGLLGQMADSVSFGVGEEKDASNAAAAADKPLPWGQLSEVTKCLLVRELLPSSITEEEQKKIMLHSAGRWFKLLRHPKMASLAMGPFVRLLMKVVEADDGTPVSIISAHDSTLIGAICALRLENPSVWPEYASCLKIEVFDAPNGGKFLRISLNGEVLGSTELEGDLFAVGEIKRLVFDSAGGSEKEL
ncbi:hypothetical protein TrVE_jg4414 [Triparma verrucosa]|uniref:Acid phosphatase n=1 Tax=Triparma verrucosa TaxID=1606542 RepID=A0A9W7ENU3_9STRA|nr:hypothetical protein TrVE_jg4414 [Triparma verrucosa]